MNDSTAGNAMTEIALALAMAFFSIMVLSMISMGTSMQAKRPALTGDQWWALQGICG